MADDASIFVVDDDASLRRALERLLRSAGYAVESFASAEAFLERMPCEGIACALLDLAMPEMDGLALQAVLVENGHRVGVLFLTGHGDVPASVAAMKGGATDFLTKPVDETVLLAAIEQSLAEQRRQLAARRQRAADNARLAALSPREFQVMRGIVDGRRNKQIAAELGISEKTVKVHRARVMEKTAVSSVAELVQLAISAGVNAAGDFAGDVEKAQ